MTSIIQFRDYSFRYPHGKFDIIQNANFSIEEGSFTLLHGLSGSGKSTLCCAMTGLIPWSVRGFIKGEVVIFGKNTRDVKPNQFAGQVGYLMQNPDSQFATLTVQDELVFAAENILVEKKVIEKRLSNIVELLDLGSYLDRNVTQLSSGEKQRVVLGSILMMEPDLLILDEPLSFLDYPNRLKLLDYLRKIRISYSNLTIILAEHRISDVSSLVDNYLEIKNGIILKSSVISSKPTKYNPDTIESFSYKGLVTHYGFSLKSSDLIVNKEIHPILEFDNISFEFMQDKGKFSQKLANVFQNLKFEIYPSEIIGIVGPNGIGKTTLLYLIAGILQPTQGVIRYNSQDISHVPYSEYSKNIGLIFQNPESQLLKNTIKKEIEFGAVNFQVPYDLKQLQDLCNFIFPIAEIETKELLKLHPFNLSWGEKRRLNLSSLFIYDPKIYLFDEPFTGQDFLARDNLIENILSIRNKAGITIISSHDDEILNICNRVFLLENDGLHIFNKIEDERF